MGNLVTSFTVTEREVNKTIPVFGVRCFACKGTRKHHLAARQVECKKCNGTGEIPVVGIACECEACNGTGKFTLPAVDESCNRCQGLGYMPIRSSKELRALESSGDLNALNGQR